MYKGKNILGLIPARGGSKGLPGKNIKTLLGKPLIAWTIWSRNSIYEAEGISKR
jgi:CMP-N-acetylneuraminic acid synthetase